MAAAANAPTWLVLAVDSGPRLECAAIGPVLMAIAARGNANGQSRFALPIPAARSLVGSRLYLQGLVAAPGGPLFGSFDASAPVALVVGR